MSGWKSHKLVKYVYKVSAEMLPHGINIAPF